MKYLFSREGRKALEELAAHSCLMAFDFDGTLAPIASRPEGALMPPRTRPAMKKLTSLVPVAVISGRSRADLRRRLGFRPSMLIGNHGLETPWAGTRARVARAQVARWLDQIQVDGDDPGVFTENKTFSLSLHYRLAADPEKARRRLKEAAKSLKPKPRLIPGHFVINVIPPGSPHKGTTLLELMKRAGCKRAFYIGDDDTDEDVFRLTNANLFTVRVGRKRSSRAQYYVHDQTEVHTLVSELLKRLAVRSRK